MAIPTHSLTQTITGMAVEAVFDGKVFHPLQPPALSPDTRVWLVVAPTPENATPKSFLQTARSLNLEGPSDWSANLDEYLYER